MITGNDNLRLRQRIEKCPRRFELMRAGALCQIAGHGNHVRAQFVQIANQRLNQMIVYRAKESEYRQLQREIDLLQKDNAQFSGQIDQLKTDPKRIEKEAREQFHYARPGEVIYVSPVLPVPQPPSTRSASK